MEKLVKKKKSGLKNDKRKKRQDNSRPTFDEQNDSVTNSSYDSNQAEHKSQSHKARKKNRNRGEDDTNSSSKKDPYSSYRPSKPSRSSYNSAQGTEDLGDQYQGSKPPQMHTKKRDQKAFEKGLDRSKSNEICKLFLTGSCHKGDDCIFSHNLRVHPCKYIHATGTCRNGEKCPLSHQRLEHHEIIRFIEENEDFLDQVYKDCGTTNLGAYYCQYKIEKEKRNKDKYRPEILTNAQDLVLPNKMRRDIDLQNTKAIIPHGRSLEGHIIETHSHNTGQMYDTFNGGSSILMANQSKEMMLNIPRNQIDLQNRDRRIQNLMTARNPPQSHREIQSHHQNIIKTQRANQIQNHMIIPISGEVPRQIDASIIGQGQRMKIAGDHIPIMSTNRQIRQEIPLRGRTMSNPRDILAQDCINRGIYNSPIVPQSTRGNPQSQYSKSPSHFRDEDLQLQRDRMSVKARSFSYNRMKIHNNQHGHHQVIPDGFPAEQENGDEKFFPKSVLSTISRSQENAEAKDQGDEVKELVRLGILPEDYEKISVSDDSD